MIHSALIAHLSHTQKVLYHLIPSAPMKTLHFVFFLNGTLHVLESSLLLFSLSTVTNHLQKMQAKIICFSNGNIIPLGDKSVILCSTR